MLSNNTYERVDCLSEVIVEQKTFQSPFNNEAEKLSTTLLDQVPEEYFRLY
jgi:hypothetical protein